MKEKGLQWQGCVRIRRQRNTWKMGLGGSTQTTQSYFKGDKRFGVLSGGGWQRRLSVWKTVRLLFSVASSGPFSSPRPGRAGREQETTVSVGESGRQ